MTGKLVYADTELLESDLDALMKKTGESSRKEALFKAVEHYLACPECGCEIGRKS